MQMKGATGVIYKICEWAMKLAYLNILWIVFSILGLIVFGLFPATTAMFAIVRKMLMGEDDASVFKTFWNSYKKEFVKSNLLGLIIVVVGYILFVNISFLRHSTGLINLIYYPTLIVGLGIILTLLYVFPTYVHYELKVYSVFINSFFIMLMNPLSTALMIIGVIAVYLLMTTIPGLIPIFSVSSLSVILMWAAFLAFSKLERGQGAALNKTEGEKNNGRSE